MSQPIGIYIHIPYCQRKCNYCNFLTYINQEDTIDDYIDYLIREIHLYQNTPHTVDTIYFGGGTPSFIDSAAIERILTALDRVFIIQKDCEITIEMNPESVNKEKVSHYLTAGINRFSMGVQSFDNDVLKIMGRLHRHETVIKNIDLMTQLGCKKIGIDLMFGNPKQDFNVLKSDIHHALQLPINHISYYSLMIKENTRFKKWLEEGKLTLINDDIERDMYHYIKKQLNEHGFNQYEISNFAKEGAESKHNKKYWQLDNYLGLGVGAASNMDLTRFQNTSHLKDYMRMIDDHQLPVSYSEIMDPEEREKEYIMLHLRLLNGFNINDLNERFNIDFMTKYQKAIEKHLHYKTISIDEGQLRFTDYGLDVGNQFYLDIL